MSHNRYDRDSRPMRSGWDDDRRPRGGMSDRDDRGFFERAGEQISSWFGDDDQDRDPRRFDQGRSRFEQPSERRPQADYRGQADRGGRSRDDEFERPYSGRPSSRDSGRDEYQPMTGDYGRSTRGESGSRRTNYGALAASSTPAHDRHYSEWRQRQMDDLDRDYESYRSENQSKFESDFSNWRSTRQTKRQMLGSIREHMEVVGADDQLVGKVDKVRGDRVILTKTDSPDGQHHSLSCAMIDRVEGDRVILDKPAEEAKSTWGSEERDRALFERDDQGEPGAHILNRSFSGTY